MAGNVDEWTATEYAPYPGAPADVPLTKAHALGPHVIRGGGYVRHRDLARCARRHGAYRYEHGQGAGFRLVADF
jgi:formylglycine-generating enzyme required for sulfatase activity